MLGRWGVMRSILSQLFMNIQINNFLDVLNIVDRDGSIILMIARGMETGNIKKI
jgi:hypothetical protein